MRTADNKHLHRRSTDHAPLPERILLGDWLVRRCLLDGPQLSAALNECHHRGCRVGDALVRLRFLDRDSVEQEVNWRGHYLAQREVALSARPTAGLAQLLPRVPPASPPGAVHRRFDLTPLAVWDQDAGLPSGCTRHWSPPPPLATGRRHEADRCPTPGRRSRTRLALLAAALTVAMAAASLWLLRRHAERGPGGQTAPPLELRRRAAPIEPSQSLFATSRLRELLRQVQPRLRGLAGGLLAVHNPPLDHQAEAALASRTTVSEAPKDLRGSRPAIHRRRGLIRRKRLHRPDTSFLLVPTCSLRQEIDLEHPP